MLKNFKKLDRKSLKEIKGGQSGMGYCPVDKSYIPCSEVCSNGQRPICGLD